MARQGLRLPDADLDGNERLISATSTTAWRLASDGKQMFGHVGDAPRQRMQLRDFHGELRPYRRLEIADLSDCNDERAGSPDHAVSVVGPNSRRRERSERAFLFRPQRDRQSIDGHAASKHRGARWTQKWP